MLITARDYSVQIKIREEILWIVKLKDGFLTEISQILMIKEQNTIKNASANLRCHQFT